MDSYHTNPQLPFDVLGLVFSHYAEEENIQHPLETLLLVCRSWTNAALDHRGIWSSLKIFIEHEPSTSIWTTRLPLRLARCGPNVPLDITLCNLLDSPRDSEMSFIDEILTKDGVFHPCGIRRSGSINPCPCYPAARAFIHSSVELLAGPHGEICHRWRSFKLISGGWPYDMQNMDHVAEALRHPTPILTTLVLKGLSLSSSSQSAFQPFPDAPVLKKVTILDCDISMAPNFWNADDVEIGITDWRNLITNTPIFDLGTRLRRLSLWLAPQANIEFPSELPNLWSLTLVIDLVRLPSGLLTCEMPQLTSLSLDISDVLTLDQLFDCRGINLSRLKDLTFNFKRIGLYHIMHHPLSESVVKLLERAGSLEYFYANKDSLTRILEMLRNAQGTQASDLLCGVCVVNLDTNDRTIFKGGDTRE